MNDTIISSTSLTILKRLDNLASERSTILEKLEENKSQTSIKKQKKEEQVYQNNNKIEEIKENINILETQSNSLKKLLNSLNTSDFAYTIDTLQLVFNPDEDNEKLEKMLPDEIKKRNDQVNDLEQTVLNDQTDIKEYEDNLSELEIRISEALNNQNGLKDLIADARNNNVNKTREEVINILKKVEFNEEDSKIAAKLIMFPEEELITYFNENDENPQEDDFSRTINEMMGLYEKNNDDDLREEVIEPVLEEDKETLNIEDELIDEIAPISLEELDKLSLELNDEEELDRTLIKVETVEDDLKDLIINSPSSETKNSKTLQEFLIENGKSKEDLVLVKDLPIEYNPQNIEILEDKGMKVKQIPLLTFKNRLDNYINNLNSLSEYKYHIDANQLEKFSASLYLTDPLTFKTNLEILKKYDFDLLKENDKLALKVLTLDSRLLIDNIDLIIEYKEEDLIKSDIEVLTKDCKAIIERILLCRKNAIPYYEEKNSIKYYHSFIYNQEELEKLVERKLDLDDVVTSSQNNENLVELIGSNFVETLNDYKNSSEYLTNINAKDDNTYFKYNNILNNINDMCRNTDNAYILNDKMYSINNVKRNLMFLVNNLSISDNDMLMLAMLYNSHQTLEEMNEFIKFMGEM